MVGNFRDELGKSFIAAGEEFPSLAVVTADVSKSTRSIEFKKRWPERFFSVGIAEANAVSIAAGIASFGHPVVFTAYGVFATEKPFEQIRNTICYPNLNVKIIATHGGISVGEDGATHQAIEDIAVMRSLPNMKVIVAADPGEVKAAVFEAIRTPGPVYVRLGRSVGGCIHEVPDHVAYEIGKAERLRAGNDVTVIAAGIMVEQSLYAADLLEKQGGHKCEERQADRYRDDHRVGGKNGSDSHGGGSQLLRRALWSSGGGCGAFCSGSDRMRGASGYVRGIGKRKRTAG